MEWRETDGHFVSFGLFIGFVDNKKNKEQQPSPLISPHLLLSGFGSLSLPPPLKSFKSLVPSLPPSLAAFKRPSPSPVCVCSCRAHFLFLCALFLSSSLVSECLH